MRNALPSGTRALIAAGMSGAPRYRVFCQNPGGRWIGVGESDPMHAKAVKAAQARGWSGGSPFELVNRGGVAFRVLEEN